MTRIDLTNYTCLVSNTADAGSFGTGFCVYRDPEVTYVVTCAHVVRNAEPEQVKVEGKAVQRMTLGEGSLDIAVLEVAGLEEQPLLQQLGIGQIGRSIQVPGIWKPQSAAHSKLVKRTLEGQLMKPVRIGSESDWTEGWDLKIAADDYELRDGYSGSPVVDVGTGCVIGVASHRGFQGFRGIAIAIHALAEVWKEMPALLLPAPEQTLNPEMKEVNRKFEHLSTRQLVFEYKAFESRITIKVTEIETLNEKVQGIVRDQRRVEPFTELSRTLERQKQSYESELESLRSEQLSLSSELEGITRELRIRGHEVES